MLACNACIERCLQAVIGTSMISSPSLRTSLSRSLRRKPFARNYISDNRKPRRVSGYDEPPQERGLVPWSTRQSDTTPTSHMTDEGKPWSPRQSDAAPTHDRMNRRDSRLLVTGGTPVPRKEYKLERTIGMVLKRYPGVANDPLKLAEYVRKALRGDDFDTALAVARSASKNLQCVVSWNHLIDWQLTKGKMNAALKTYNEMKKRGQTPDAHTYTIIIRGCTNHKDLKQALAKVMAIYHSMMADKSPVKPNPTHLNAIVKMCARAKDMEAMFSIVATMRTRGLGSPDNLTYTTVLNALRMHAVGDFRNTLTMAQKRHNSQEAILRGRQMWNDITKRWRQGEMWVDEELVCAMGRLMLIGVPQDKDDILSLIEQSMSIPRQVPRMGTPDRKLIEPSSQGREHVELSSPAVEAHGEIVSEEEPKAIGRVSEDSFMIVTPPDGVRQPNTAYYAKPGRNSLSLVLEAVTSLRLIEPAHKYWNIFVNQIGVKPDIENYHAYLRVLRIARASTLTVELLQVIPQHDMRAATFRIAMSACERDKNNPNAFANSGKVLDIMTTAIEVPDIPVLTSYLEIAISAAKNTPTPPSKSNEPPEPKLELSKQAQGKQIIRALERLNPSFLNLKSLLLFGDHVKSKHSTSEQIELQESALLLTRRMIGAYDLLMDKALVERSKYTELTQSRSKLAAFITRQSNRSTYRRFIKSDIRELPPHLAKYVFDNRLSKAMVEAQLSPKKWTAFFARVQREYESSLQQVEQAKEMQEDSAKREQDRSIKEEEQAASKGVFQDPAEESFNRRQRYSTS